MENRMDLMVHVTYRCNTGIVTTTAEKQKKQVCSFECEKQQSQTGDRRLIV